MSDRTQPTKIPVAFHETETDDPGSLRELPVTAMAAARGAQAKWAQTSVTARLKCVRHLRSLIAEHAEVLAASSARPRRRPVLESLSSEVLPLADACCFLEREAPGTLAGRRLGQRRRPAWLPRGVAEIRREPFGVILIIGPANYPLFLPGVQVIQSLVAGNAVLLKPAVGGSESAAMLQDLILRAGFPVGLLHLLPSSTEAARAAISTRPDKVLLTGSAKTGQSILTQLAHDVIPATVELSGCDAVIVRSDADLDLTVRALVFGLRLNEGATCIAPRRVYVHRAVATELEGRLATALAPNAITPASAPINCGAQEKASWASSARERTWPLIEEALARGAHFIFRGGDDGPFVLAGVHPESRLLQEDVFAPVLSVITVADDSEALRWANDCPFALGASIFSGDTANAQHLANALNAGVVTVNDLIVPTADPRLPFGGRGRSGFGATRGAEGLLELTRPKVVTTSRGHFRPAFGPPRAADPQLFAAYLIFTHGCGLIRRCHGFGDFVRAIFSRNKANSRNTVL